MGFGRVQETEAGERVATPRRRLGCLLSKREAGEGVVLAVEGDVAVAQEAVSDGDTGRLDYDFNADGFGPTCDPNKPPPFDTTGKSRKMRERLMATGEENEAPKPRAKPVAKGKADAGAGVELKAGN